MNIKELVVSCVFGMENKTMTTWMTAGKPMKVTTEELDVDYYVYTDGACSNNGKSSATAGIGVFFAENDSRNISKRITGKQTNNTAELQAILEAFSVIEKDLLNKKRVCVVSDSEYAIRCVSSYGQKCCAKGWTMDIPNKELVRSVYELVHQEQTAPFVCFLHVRAHTGGMDVHSIGNAWADKLAVQAISPVSLESRTKTPSQVSPIAELKAPLSSKIYLDVPFSVKDECKQLGGLWDAQCKKWFVYSDNPHRERLTQRFCLPPL